MDNRVQQPDVKQHVRVTMSDGAVISLRRWGEKRRRRLVISHGNGLAVDGLWAFGRKLLDAFEVIAFDMRNHGQSGSVAQGEMPWPRYIADIPEIFDAIRMHFGACETHGAFHSMSAACSLIAQSLTPRPWASLTLFEPPVPPSSKRFPKSGNRFSDKKRGETQELERFAEPSEAKTALEQFTLMQDGIAGRTLRRRRLFATPQDLANSFAGAPSFFGIEAADLLALARATLRHVDDGWALACAPEIEAANFVTAPQLVRYWHDLNQIDVPVQIIIGDKAVHDMPVLADFGQWMGKEFSFPVHVCAGSNHFMQLQQPQLCAERVIAFADEHLEQFLKNGNRFSDRN